jgi:DNA invertase Pin-like site-specific DNA recombinase
LIMTKMKGSFIAYLRVSTDRQGRSGLGLDAQREAVQRFVRERGGEIAGSYVEVESGRRDDRPELAKAMKRCRLTGATLVVAKLDRLSRNAAFLLMLRDSGVGFVAADLPEANTMTVGVMAVVAQHEREAISHRTKAALAAAKARGTKLGGYRENAPNVRQFQGEGVAASIRKADAAAEERREILETLRREIGSYNGIARRLNAEGITTARDGSWTATAVRRALSRLD